jgi:hypothetical protein
MVWLYHDQTNSCSILIELSVAIIYIWPVATLAYGVASKKREILISADISYAVSRGIRTE